MIFQAEINIMPLKELLDPKGKAVESNLGSINLPEISNVRIGKRVTLSIDAENEAAAKSKVEAACKKLLANPVMEQYEFELSQS